MPYFIAAALFAATAVLRVRGERLRFSMRCVGCGLLLSEAEEAAGLQCVFCERTGEAGRDPGPGVR